MSNERAFDEFLTMGVGRARRQGVGQAFVDTQESNMAGSDIWPLVGTGQDVMSATDDSGGDGSGNLVSGAATNFPNPMEDNSGDNTDGGGGGGATPNSGGGGGGGGGAAPSSGGATSALSSLTSSSNLPLILGGIAVVGGIAGIAYLAHRKHSQGSSSRSSHRRR